MEEIIVNLHMHTRYSDGNAHHSEIATAAIRVGIDAVIVTDHNVWVAGPAGYYTEGEKKALLLIGEEIHDQAREPQKCHLMVMGVEKELATLANEPQKLLDVIKKAGGLAFIAHPVDPASPAVGEGDLGWVDWNLQEYTGLELWNAMSEFKGRLKTKLHALFYAYNPRRVAQGPFPEAIKKWDELLMGGKKVFAIGGSDAHALDIRLGPLRRIIFPYEFHFRAVNTHLLLNRALQGDYDTDRKLVLEALENGRAFIGYDLPASTRGFRFTAEGITGSANMGESISAQKGITFKIRLPKPAECHLVKDGKVVKTWKQQDTVTFITGEPGYYRVEAYIYYLGSKRGWIYSNPIFVTD